MTTEDKIVERDIRDNYSGEYRMTELHRNARKTGQWLAQDESGETSYLIGNSKERLEAYIESMVDSFRKKYALELETVPDAANDHDLPYKPTIETAREGDNIFGIVAGGHRALKRVVGRETANRMKDRAMDAGSYDEALAIVREYCVLPK